jgi:two-component system cell cycle response regulator DivK
MASTVLVVDDERYLREMLRDALSLYGHDVLLATGGEEGVRSAEEHRPDLILMDLMMPGVNGFEAVSRIRANAATAGRRVVALTAIATLSRAAAREAGFDGLLIKPSSVSAIQAYLP